MKQAVAVHETTIVDFCLDDYVIDDHQVPRKADNVLAGLTGNIAFAEKQRRINRPIKAPAVASLAGAGTLTAQYPGGLSELFVFVARQTHYPKAARKADVEGRVIVSLLIDEQGLATAPTIVEGLGYGCDEEAVRVL
jgi:outer membrane biosynthesis protein TonB